MAHYLKNMQKVTNFLLETNSERIIFKLMYFFYLIKINFKTKKNIDIASLQIKTSNQIPYKSGKKHFSLVVFFFSFPKQISLAQHIH